MRLQNGGVLFAAILIARHLEAPTRIPTIAAPSFSHSGAAIYICIVLRRFEAEANIDFV
jgi:hypothetical protein